MGAVAVKDVVLAFGGCVYDLVCGRNFEERGWLISTAEFDDGGGELSRPGIAVHAAHDEFEVG